MSSQMKAPLRRIQAGQASARIAPADRQNYARQPTAGPDLKPASRTPRRNALGTALDKLRATATWALCSTPPNPAPRSFPLVAPMSSRTRKLPTSLSVVALDLARPEDQKNNEIGEQKAMD